MLILGLDFKQMKNNKSKLLNQAFTIVELLVVIVVIGILAAITIVSYSGIANKAITAGLQSDLDNNSKQLKLYNVEYGYYPSTLDGNNCPLTPTADTKYCLKASTDTDLTYTGGGQSFTVTATKKSIKYQVTESSSPSILLGLSGPDWITVGTQTWAKANLNVGTMVTSVTAQTNNGGTNTVEKYCYNNDEANCTTYGGFYQWDEAMKYTNAEKAQGICPAGSHIPSDAEWKTLEMSLSGMSQATADTTGWRGTDEGTKLKSGGSSGLNIPLAGYRTNGGSFSALSSDALLWSSSESGASARYRNLVSGYATVYRDTNVKVFGFSVRCLGN